MIHIPEWRHVRRRGSILCAITQHGWKEISSMKRTTKKTLFVFVLIAAMMLSIFPAAAFAEGAAAVEPAAQTEQQPEKDAAPAANDDGVKPAEPAKDDGAKPAEPVKDGENKAEPVKNDAKPVVVEVKDGEKPADPETKDGEEKNGEPKVKNDGEEPVKEEENTGDATKTPEEETGDEKAEEEKDVPAVSDAARAFLAAASAFTMPEDVMALTDEECQTLAAQIKDLFVMYLQLSEEDLALPEVQAAAAVLNAAYATLDARNTAEVLAEYNSIPLNLTVTCYGAPFISGSTGQHTVKEYYHTEHITRDAAGSRNPSGSATGRFIGSNETGWTLVIDIAVGNYKTTVTTNARITNKDMSAATGTITFGMSFGTAGGVGTTIRIRGAKDLPKPSPTPSPTPTPTPTPTPIPSSTPTPTPSTSPSPAPVVKATLNYDGNGAGVTNVPPSESKDVEPNTFAEFTVSSTVPERAGYTFKGWNTKADGSGLSYSAGDTVKVFAGTSETLYAQWDEDKQEATLVFGPNAGTDTVDNMPSDMTDTPKAGETSVAFPIPTTIPTREGYEFKHWNTKDDDSGDTYERGATIDVPVGTTGTLYAIWGDKNLDTDLLETKLIYDANAEDAVNVDPAVVTQNVARGEKAQFIVTSDKPTRPGYTFAGWSIIPDAEVAYNPDSVVEVEAGAEMILYAVWVKNVKLEIIYDGNADGVQNVPGPDVEWVEPNGSFVFTIANGPTRPGYRFVEWNTAENGTGDSIKPGQTTLLHAGETGYSKTYYAKWEPEEVTPIDWGKLGISKSVSPAGPVKPGTTLTYTITVTNNTGADLDSVVVYDKLDRHLTFVSATGAGSYSTLSGFWNVGALANGASATLVIKATVKAGTADKTVIYNTARVFSASVGSEKIPDGSRPSASANVAVTNPGSGTWGGTTWGKGVQTGDDANLGLWIAAMIVSFLCVAALVYVNRKRIFKGKANNK